VKHLHELPHSEFLKLSMFVPADYLGDGLYVSFDGMYIILSAERENGIHWVAIEPPQIHELVGYFKKIAEEVEKQLADNFN
jgi:hypothetical protein